MLSNQFLAIGGLALLAYGLLTEGDDMSDDAPADDGSSSQDPANEISPPRISSAGSVAPSIVDKWGDLAQQASDAYGVRRELILSVIQQESGGDPSAAAAGSSARGLMQLTKGAASDVGADHDALFDPETNVMAGTDYLARQLCRFAGDERLALVAYNQGAGVAGKPADRRFAEGDRYAASVLGRANATTFYA